MQFGIEHEVAKNVGDMGDYGVHLSDRFNSHHDVCISRIGLFGAHRGRKSRAAATNEAGYVADACLLRYDIFELFNLIGSRVNVGALRQVVIDEKHRRVSRREEALFDELSTPETGKGDGGDRDYRQPVTPQTKSDERSVRRVTPTGVERLGAC